MSALVWSDALVLSMPVMDHTHQEFVELLALVQQADDITLMGHWQALIDHTVGHFGQEDDWMQATGFARGNCHSTQHAVVLEVMRDSARRGAQGELDWVRRIATELADWFPHHAQTMDAGLALHIKSVGYDPETGLLQEAAALPAQAITGCGSNSCHDKAAANDTQAPQHAEAANEPVVEVGESLI